MWWKEQLDSGIGLIVMINEKLPPKITSYFGHMLNFFMKRLKERNTKLENKAQPRCQN